MTASSSRQLSAATILSVLAIVAVPSILAVVPASAQTPEARSAYDYPLIRSLGPRDVVYVQLQDALAQSYRAERTASPYPDLFICRWVAAGGEDLFAVAARLNVPYDTLATLNGLSRPRPFEPGEAVLVPSIAGLFVPSAPASDFEAILKAGRSMGPSGDDSVSVWRSGGAVVLGFLPGARLNATERSFFLNVGFRMPLPTGLLTSRYGYRRSPIDGHDRMHEGVDLAAPLGSDVVAARDGTVLQTGNDSALGLFVVLDHGGGLSTVYGHLSAVDVVLNQTVRSGTIVGAVGSTGLSTGPHLHFEIRLSGQAKDPSRYLPGLKP